MTFLNVQLKSRPPELIQVMIQGLGSVEETGPGPRPSLFQTTCNPCHECSSLFVSGSEHLLFTNGLMCKSCSASYCMMELVWTVCSEVSKKQTSCPSFSSNDEDEAVRRFHSGAELATLKAADIRGGIFVETPLCVTWRTVPVDCLPETLADC